MGRIIIPAILTSYRPKVDKSFSLSFNVNEPTDDQYLFLKDAYQKGGFLMFKEEEFKKEEVNMIESLKHDAMDDKGKSRSQKLRSVLYLLWEKNNNGMTSEKFYEKEMDRIIEHYKGKLD